MFKVTRIEETKKNNIARYFSDYQLKEVMNYDIGNYLVVDDDNPTWWRVIPLGVLNQEYKFLRDDNDMWQLYEKRDVNAQKLQAIVIRKSNADEIKAIIPIEDAEAMLLNHVGDILVLKENRTHEVITDGHFDSLYKVKGHVGPWMYLKRKDLAPNTKRHLEGFPAVPDEDEQLKQMNSEVAAEEKEFKVTQTTHNKTDMLALEITEENYSIAAAFLPQGFTTIPVKNVIGYFVVLNERKVQIEVDTGMVAGVAIGNLVVHPDIFHDIYIAVEFAGHGDFLKCRKEK